jgi:hypothetical protein
LGHFDLVEICSLEYFDLELVEALKHFDLFGICLLEHSDLELIG